MSDDLGFVQEESPKTEVAPGPTEDLGFVSSPPDTQAMKDYVQLNLQKAREKNPKIAENYYEAFKAGLELSVPGLMVHGAKPDVVPDQSDRASRIIGQIGTVAGDFPFMIAGGAAGGVAAGPAGAAGAAFALPTALRKIMMDHYERGDITTAGEFWDRLSSTSWETIKSAAVGVATMGAGKYAKIGLAAAGAEGALVTSGVMASEVATMTTTGAALEGHLPDADNFLDAALVVGGFHGLLKVAPKLREIYASTGTKPGDIVEETSRDPILKQDLLTDSPRFLKAEDAANLEVFRPKEIEPFNPDVGIQSPQEIIMSKPDVEVKQVEEGQTPKLFNDKIPRTEAELKVLSRLGERVEPSVPFKERVKNNLDSIYTAVWNDLHPIYRAVQFLAEGNTKSAMEAYQLSALSRNWGGRFSQFMKENTIDFHTGKSNGEGFAQILRDVPNKDRDGVLAYIMSKRAIEKSGQNVTEKTPNGIETGIDLESAKAVVSAGAERFDGVFRRLVEFQKRTLDYAVDSGLLNKESRAAMEKLNKDYAPFYRLKQFDPLAASGPGAKLFAKMTGSDLKILDPLQYMKENTAAIIKAAELNYAKVKLVELAEKSEKGEALFVKSKSEQGPTKVESKEIQAFFKKHGVDPASVPDAAMKIYRPRNSGMAENEFGVMRDGKFETWRTKPELADAVKALDFDTGMTNFWYDNFVKGPARALRAGVTQTPDFIMRNLFRDQITAGAQSKYKQIPFWDSIESVKNIVNNEQSWQDYKNSRGIGGAYGETTKYIEEDVWKLNKETGFMDATWNVLKHPLDVFRLMKELSETVEAVPRYTEHRLSEGGIEGDYASKEVTVDFSRAGWLMRSINPIVPFMGVGLQGLDRAGRAFLENPLKFSGQAGASVTLPTIMLWLRNKDDSRYKSLPNWQKDLFWILTTNKWESASASDAGPRADDMKRQLPDGSWEVNNGHIFRLPKPFEVGILYGSFPERVLNGWHNNDPEALNKFGQTVWNGLNSLALPTVLNPALEQMTNHVFFTGNPVVPQQLQEEVPETQYMEYTSETAKQLAKIIGHVPFIRDFGSDKAKLNSPMVVDNYIREWSGTLGQYAVQLADQGLRAAGLAADKVPPASTLADVPFIKAFIIRNPSAKTQYIEDFYDNYNKATQVRNSFNNLKSQGKMKEALELRAVHDEDFVKLNGIHDSMKTQNQLIQKIMARGFQADGKTPLMSRNDKRQLIDKLYYLMSMEAAQGNEIVKQYRHGLQNK